MRAPFHGEADVRKTAWYTSALGALSAYAELHRFEGAGSFYAWERLNMLVEQLSELFDAFELEGDVAPVRQAVADFQADIARLPVKPDATLATQLGLFLDGLETPLTVATHRVPALPEPEWSDSYMAVHPAALAELLAQKTADIKHH